MDEAVLLIRIIGCRDLARLNINNSGIETFKRVIISAFST
jgi:hypothetical protein